VVNLRARAPEPEPIVDVAARPDVPAAPAGTIRTTVYSDPRIEDFLRDVAVQALGARIDLTKAAVWRWAMTELMERYRPAEVVEHFRSVASEHGRIGRPRR
jgi:hypothetical protein